MPRILMGRYRAHGLLMLPKRNAFFRSLVNSSLDSEMGRTSHCFLTRLSLFEGNPLRVQAAHLARVNGCDIYLFA